MMELKWVLLGLIIQLQRVWEVALEASVRFQVEIQFHQAELPKFFRLKPYN